MISFQRPFSPLPWDCFFLSFCGWLFGEVPGWIRYIFCTLHFSHFPPWKGLGSFAALRFSLRLVIWVVFPARQYIYSWIFLPRQTVSADGLVGQSAGQASAGVPSSCGVCCWFRWCGEVDQWMVVEWWPWRVCSRSSRDWEGDGGGSCGCGRRGRGRRWWIDFSWGYKIYCILNQRHFKVDVDPILILFWKRVNVSLFPSLLLHSLIPAPSGLILNPTVSFFYYRLSLLILHYPILENPKKVFPNHWNITPNPFSIIILCKPTTTTKKGFVTTFSSTVSSPTHKKSSSSSDSKDSSPPKTSSP